ncbi:OLC1v1015113C1 [Oldenlandia corymbosa var. corymbosa]|uniref:OLC1v1015113C1 n=1 Tax=Oldenlandia corymbosa var. corymbosa TaxID=529605 RepID=A0AAV1E2F9_OLDCO|nr:OLC1v1015113C1 [Oldenlandia corymbosa var. corymbosa]
MVSAGSSKSEGGTTTHVISAGVRKTIRQIKEIVGNHSEADIYVTLKESNMDPNETTQKLLNQDPFHEVRRKRDKKKEFIQNMQYKGSTASEPKRNPERRAEYVSNAVNPAMQSDRNARRSGYSRNSSSGVSREFRVVRDNRGKQNSYQESKPVQSSSSTNDLPVTDGSVKSSAGTSVNQKPPFVRNSSQASGADNNSQTRHFKDGNISVTVKKDFPGDRRVTVTSTAPQIQLEKSNDLQLPSTASSSNSVVGVYSSSSDPVHVPSPDSRPTAKIGAIKREVGVVGANRQNSDSSARLSSLQASSVSNLQSSREGPAPRSFGTLSKVDNSSQHLVAESAVASLSVSRSFANSQYNSRSHQLSGHQKASQPNKEWKPKSSQKASTNGPGIIGSPTNAAPPMDNSKDSGREAAELEDKMSRANISENQNVIIASHIRVSDTDRYRLIFGTLDPDFEPQLSTLVAGAEESSESTGLLPVSSSQESSRNEPATSKPQDLVEDYSRSSGTDSPASVAASDHQQNDKKEASNPSNLDSYADMRLSRENNAAYVSQESHQHQAEPELPPFSGYDPQSGYDMSYFGPTVDDPVRGQGLPSPQEVLNTHGANSIPSSMAMIQQQQQQQQVMAQMYPQLHFANMMPYRQFLSPVYVPPMAVPGYSSNPAYPHPSNGSSYVLMPGTSSHLTANGLKYGMQAFKPVPTSNPTGFGNFASPTGYTVNAPGIVGNATGLEDSSRLKYKDGNFYVPNLPAETSEIWMNQRDMQSASYYNMPGQAPHAAAYMPSHSGHASYNPAAAAAVAHSSHMQFPGLYHPTPQPAAIANPHHLGPAMGGNVGVAAGATGAQVGAYHQQPQLGHLNWTANF